MHYIQDDFLTISMIVGNVFIGISALVLSIRVGVIGILMYRRANNPNSNFQNMKKLMLVGQGLLLVGLASICITLFFGLGFPFYAVTVIFAVCVAFTGLNTWIWYRKINKWFS